MSQTGVTADSLTFTRKRGRPPVAEPSQPVTTWLPPAYLARLDAIALKHDVAVSKLVRRILMDALRKR